MNNSGILSLYVLNNTFSRYKSVSYSLKQSIILEFHLKNITGKSNYIESTNRIYMDPIIFHLIMSIALPKKYDIIQVVHKDVQ